MEAAKSSSFSIQHFFTISITVILACAALFSLDKDTHSFADLFKPVNLAALVIYFTPTFLISVCLYIYFLRKNNKKKSIVLALVTGIPVGFILVICVLLSLKP